MSVRSRGLLHYNIPSNNRELQLFQYLLEHLINYNIPSNNRELQRKELNSVSA